MLRVLSLRQGARRELALPSGGPSRRVVGSRAVLCSSGGRGPARLFLLLSPLPLESQPQKVTCESRVQELSAACARVREVCGFGSRTPAFRRLGGDFPVWFGTAVQSRSFRVAIHFPQHGLSKRLSFLQYVFLGC